VGEIWVSENGGPGSQLVLKHIPTVAAFIASGKKVIPRRFNESEDKAREDKAARVGKAV